MNGDRNGAAENPNAPETPAPWYARPRVVLPAFVALLVLSTLFAEDLTIGRTGDPRLSTYHTQPQGAALFYDLTERLG